MSPAGPELLDICITTRCNRGCAYCYQDAKPDGDDMPVDLYDDILFETQGTVCQVALGGGEVTLHPEFCEILRLTREDYGIVPNYTTNGDNISDEVLEATKKYCGAVAVSAHGKIDEWMPKAWRFVNAGIKTNIHYIIGNDTVEEATDLLARNTLCDSVAPMISGGKPKSLNAIVFLLYKPCGRASKDGMLQPGPKVDEFLKVVQGTKTKVGFDACSIPMLLTKTNFNPVSFDTCEGSRFSGYVHVGGQAKPCSFDKNQYASIGKKRFRDIWREDFESFRGKLTGCQCLCEKKSECLGGCPVYNDIVICDSPGRVKTV
jgi:MoaA/NifB/PqqE/SkfB family radical SAM enzyme